MSMPEEEVSRMQEVTKIMHADAVGCEGLAKAGLMDTAGCRGTCHSADGYSHGRTMGSCRIVLPDGGEAFICCSGKRRLQARTDEREVVGA